MRGCMVAGCMIGRELASSCLPTVGWGGAGQGRQGECRRIAGDFKSQAIINYDSGCGWAPKWTPAQRPAYTVPR